MHQRGKAVAAICVLSRAFDRTPVYLWGLQGGMCLQVRHIKKAFSSIDEHADGDERALSSASGGPLDPTLLETVDAHGQPHARLYRSKTASCKGGHFLVRSTDSMLSKVDYFAYVPYTCDDSDSDSAAGGDAIMHDNQPLPRGFSTVLKVHDIYAWHQTSKDGVPEVFRFALGKMYALLPVGDSKHGFELEYTDGHAGGRGRRPSLLTKATSRRYDSYDYGVWLDQIDCTLVSTVDEKFFVPTLKLCDFG